MGEEQLGKLGKKEDEEREPAIKQRREYTVFRFDLGEREEQVCVCVYPSSSLGWRYGMNRNSGSCRQPN